MTRVSPATITIRIGKVACAIASLEAVAVRQWKPSARATKTTISVVFEFFMVLTFEQFIHLLRWRVTRLVSVVPFWCGTALEAHRIRAIGK